MSLVREVHLRRVAVDGFGCDTSSPGASCTEVAGIVRRAVGKAIVALYIGLVDDAHLATDDKQIALRYRAWVVILKCGLRRRLRKKNDRIIMNLPSPFVWRVDHYATFYFPAQSY